MNIPPISSQSNLQIQGNIIQRSPNQIIHPKPILVHSSNHQNIINSTSAVRPFQPITTLSQNVQTINHPSSLVARYGNSPLVSIPNQI